MATTAVPKRIVVCGGNGFLGSRICKAAAARGWNVTSISRSGEPKWDGVTSSAIPPPWAKDVTWRSANVLQPSQYRDVLAGADAVVHSMGILLEADYKGVLTGKEPVVAGLQRAFSSVKQGTANPLEQSGEDLRPLERDGQITYEVMNRDSAILLAQEAANAKVPVFGYISAAGGAPILPGRYITTKRAAEEAISTKLPQLRSFFIRNGFLYDPCRAYTMALAGPTFAVAMFNSLVGGALSGPSLGGATAKPLKADLVAESVVEAIADEAISGPVEIPQIEALANREWRRQML